MSLPRGAIRADAAKFAEELLASPSQPTLEEDASILTNNSASELALVHRFIGLFLACGDPVLQREAAFSAAQNGRAKPIVTKCADICLSGDSLAYLGAQLLAWLSLCPSSARVIADEGISFAFLSTFPLLDVRSPLAVSVVSALLASTAAEIPATLQPLITEKGSRALVKALAAIQEPIEGIPGHVLAETRVALLTLMIRAARTSFKGRATMRSAVVPYEGLLSYSSKHDADVGNSTTQAANTLAGQLELLLQPNAVPISRAPFFLPSSNLNTGRNFKDADNLLNDGGADAATFEHDQEKRHDVAVAIEDNPHASPTELRGAGEGADNEQLNIGATRPLAMALSSGSVEISPYIEVSDAKATMKLKAEPKDTAQFIESNKNMPRTGEELRDEASILLGLRSAESVPSEPKPHPQQATRKVSKKAAKQSYK